MFCEHMAFAVSDPKEAARWYCEHLAMRVVRHGSGGDIFVADARGHVVFQLEDARCLDDALGKGPVDCWRRVTGITSPSTNPPIAAGAGTRSASSPSRPATTSWLATRQPCVACTTAGSTRSSAPTASPGPLRATSITPGPTMAAGRGARRRRWCWRTSRTTSSAAPGHAWWC